MPSALVTGGSSGIGLAIAAMLREEGYALTLGARKPDRLHEAATRLGATASVTDVTREEDCAAIVAAHVAAHGGLDVLVNSAGVGMAAAIADTTTKRFDVQFAVNLRGAFLVTRAALPHLRTSSGLVVNLASIAGTIPTPGLATYGASKAALISLSRSLAYEEAAHGIRVTALCPGFVDTPMAEFTGLESDEMIQPKDCAELVRALLRLSPAVRIPVIVVERSGERV